MRKIRNSQIEKYGCICCCSNGSKWLAEENQDHKMNPYMSLNIYIIYKYK